MPEIDEVELRGLHKLKQTVQTIIANPAAKKLVEQAHKMVDPNALTPALDQEKVINEPINAALARMAELQKTIEDERAERAKADKLNAVGSKIDTGLAKLRSEGWTEEGITGVRKLMDDNGIIDPEIAASHFEKLHPPQLPSNPSGTGAWNFMEQVSDGEADLKKLIETKGESQIHLDKMARDALNEVRGQSRR